MCVCVCCIVLIYICLFVVFYCVMLVVGVGMEYLAQDMSWLTEIEDYSDDYLIMELI